MFSSILFFGAAWLLVVLSTPWLIRAANVTGFGLDYQSDFRKMHDGRVCRLGGLPIFAAMLGAFAIIDIRQIGLGENVGNILLGMTLMFGLGMWDDIRPLGAKMKLTGQVAIAVLVVSLGLQIDSVTYPGSSFAVSLGTMGAVLTVLWLIAVPNIINLIDGVDGLAAGIGVFLAITLGVVALISQQFGVACLTFAMAGALLGFLHFNFPPARIFLGDGGAYLIGFSVAALSVQSENKGSVAAALLVTFIALGLPILDTTLAIGRRAIQGFPLMQADKGHIHHRLHRLGFSKHRVVLSLYAVCVTLSLLGLSIFWSQGRSLPIAAGALVLLAVLALRYLGYTGGVYTLGRRIRHGLSRRRNVQYALLQSQVLGMEVERCVNASEFWKVFFMTLQRLDLHQHCPEAGAMHAVTLRGEQGNDILLYVAADKHSFDYAERIVSLFTKPFRLGCERWPEEVPLPSSTTSCATQNQAVLEAAAASR